MSGRDEASVPLRMLLNAVSTELGCLRHEPVLDVFIRGQPKAQPRPRAFIRGDHTSVYNPDTADEWKKLVAQAIRDDAPPKVIEGPVLVALQIWMPRPARLKKVDELVVMHDSKPDVDNLVKAVFDAVTDTGLVWRDDSQVADLQVCKLYSPLAAPDLAGCRLEIRRVLNITESMKLQSAEENTSDY